MEDVCGLAPQRSQVRLSRQSITARPAATTNATALAQTGTTMPLIDTGQARMNRSNWRRATSANTIAAIVVNGFTSLSSYRCLIISREQPCTRGRRTRASARCISAAAAAARYPLAIGLPSTLSWHRRSDCLSHWNTCRIEIVKAMHVDSKVIRCNPFAMERVDATGLAEEMGSGSGMEAVFGEKLCSGQQSKVTLMHFDHERIPAFADGAVTHGELRKIGLNLETHCTAVAGSCVALHRSRTHCGTCRGYRRRSAAPRRHLPGPAIGFIPRPPG